MLCFRELLLFTTKTKRIYNFDYGNKWRNGVHRRLTLKERMDGWMDGCGWATSKLNSYNYS